MVSGNIKKVIIIISIVGIFITAFFVVNSLRLQTEEFSIEVLSYSIRPSVSNFFHLMDNDIYEDRILSGDQLVVNSLINNLNTIFTIDIMSKGSEIDLNIEHVLKLEAYYSDYPEPLFQKKELIYKDHINGENLASFFKWSGYNLDGYKSFLEDSYTVTGVNTSEELKAIWRIKGTISGNNKVAHIDETMVLKLPISEGVIQIEKVNFETINESLTEKMQVEQPKPKGKLFLLISVMILCIAGLVVVVMLKTKPKKSDYELEKMKIFKLYGERLVKLYEPMTNNHSNPIHVSGVDDLVKISDEIRQPVFYFEVADDDEKKIEYYVFDETRIYYKVMFDVVNVDFDNFIKENTE